MSRPTPDPRGVKKLRSIQRAFATGIMRPLTPDRQSQAKWVDGKSAKKAAAQFIKPNDRLTSFDRLEIYNKQYWFRLLDSLYEDFPGLRSLIGEERFYDLSVAYLQKHPSDSYTLRDLGQYLEKFLKKNPQWAGTNHSLALDIVRLEWSHIVAFDGEWLPPLEVDQLLDSGDPAKLRLGIQPCISFLACAYSIDHYLLAVRRREEPRGEASNAVTERVKKKPQKKIALPKPEKIHLAIHRSDNAVYYKRLEKEAYFVCSALQKGLTLQSACERAVDRRKIDPDFGSRLQGWFAQWASFGWFCRAE